MTITRASTHPDRLLGGLAAALAALIGCYLVLGPLGLGAIHLRTSTDALRQVKGGDLAAAAAVLPASLYGAWLAYQGRASAPVVLLGPAVFAAYTYSQIFLGSEYALYPGNVERFAPLFGALFMVGVSLAAASWQRIDGDIAGAVAVRTRRVAGWIFIGVAGFVVFGIHARSYLDALSAHPSSTAYLEAPTAFWVVKFWDLFVIAPIAFTVGIGLLHARQWAAKAMVGVLAGVSLLAISVTGMAVVMYLGSDPAGSIWMIAAATAISSTGLWACAVTMRRYERFSDIVDQRDDQGPGVEEATVPGDHIECAATLNEGTRTKEPQT